MPSDAELHLHEYLDISTTLRHYGNLQFAQLTICIALAGGGALLLFSKDAALTGWLRVIVQLGLAGITLMFLSMSARVSDYWNTRTARARELENTLGFRQYTETPPLRHLSNRLAVAFVYWSIIALLLCSAFRDLMGAA